MITDDWRECDLGQALTLQRGYDLPHRLRREGDISIISSSGVSGMHNQAQVSAPGIVTGRYGTIGEVFFVQEDFWPLNTTLYVRDFKGNDPLFLSYLLRTIDFESHSGKSGVPGVNRNDLHKLLVVLPPPVEQRAIAAALSDVDALLAALDTLIAKKRAVKQATMQQLLTGATRLPGFEEEWEEKAVSTFAECTAGGTPSTLHPEYWGGEIRWMNSGELNLKRVYEVEGRITKKGMLNSSSKLLLAKSVLIGLAGQGKTRGTTAISMVPLCTNQSIAAILPNRSFIPEFLYQFLDSKYEYLRGMSAGDGGRGGLNLHIIRSVKVPFPRLEEQQAIATVLSNMDAEIEALERRHEKARQIKQGMMQQLLTGRVRLLQPMEAESEP